MRAARCALILKIDSSFLINHPISALHLILLSNDCPSLVGGNINMEPATIPFQSYTANICGQNLEQALGLTNTPITYDSAASVPSDSKKCFRSI